MKTILNYFIMFLWIVVTCFELLVCTIVDKFKRKKTDETAEI
jgi:hypothetical protein